MGITKQEFAYVMRDDMDLYAHEVNERRAIPALQDGLKPSMRRIIYTMAKDVKDYRGCADIVGNCLGRFAPHGDSSCYGALVRLSQPLIMNYPLIDFQGNNGSLTDPPAAYRYTKAKLSPYGKALLDDINIDGVIEWQDNYAETEKEPKYLLGSLGPLNLLINPNLGIGVGIASSWICHRLSDVREVLNYRMAHPNCSFEELPPLYPSFVRGGGTIVNKKDIPNIYKTGKGTVVVRAKYFWKDHVIYITEMPYRVAPTTVKKHLISHPIAGISEVYEGQGGYPLKIYLDKDADEEAIQDLLFRKTQLQTTINVNMVATDLDGKPRIFTLMEILDTAIMLQHRRFTKIAEHNQNLARQKLHINEGLEKALDIIDEVIAIVRASESPAIAETNLISRLGIDNAQAKAILDIRLSRLSHMEVDAVRQEIKSLKDQIKYQQSIIDDKDVRESLYQSELAVYTDSSAQTECLDLISVGADGDKIKSDGYAIAGKDFFEYHTCEDQFEDGIVPRKYKATSTIYLVTSHLRGFLKKGTDLPIGRTDWKDILSLEDGETVVTMVTADYLNNYNYAVVACTDGKEYNMHNSFITCGCSVRGKRLTKSKYEVASIKFNETAIEAPNIR